MANGQREPLKSIGGCRIISKIGQGGMGTVYKGHHEALDLDVAVKLLPEHLARQGDMAARFLREARLAARVNHPEIVRVFGRKQEAAFAAKRYEEVANAIEEAGGRRPHRRRASGPHPLRKDA